MEFRFEVLPEKGRKTIELLGRSGSFLDNFYLAGGTGLALQIGHRKSEDFDFFSSKEFSENILIQNLLTLGKFELENKAQQTITGFLNDTKVAFFSYPYPLLSPLKEINGLKLASVLDIACMKIDALASRGTKRDFIDIYFITKDYFPLPQIIKSFDEKYAKVHYNLLHIKKSLVYFADAENDAPPVLLKKADWQEVKQFFQREIKKLI